MRRTLIRLCLLVLMGSALLVPTALPDSPPSNSRKTVYWYNDVMLTRPTAEFDLEAARGLLSGYKWVGKFGRNPAVGTSQEAVWFFGGDYTGFLDTATNIEVVSDDANDDADGSPNDGCNTVVVEGLDENFAMISETFTMNGLTPVVASVETLWTRVFRAYCTESGIFNATLPSTTGTNIGSITVRGASSGPVLASINAGLGQTQLAIYTIPAGYTGFMRRVNIFVDVSSSNSFASVSMMQRRNVDDNAEPFPSRRLVRGYPGVQGSISTDYDFAVSFPEKTDVWFRAIKVGAGSDVGVTVTFDMMLVPNSS